MTVTTEQSNVVFTGVIGGVALNLPFPVQQAADVIVRYGSANTVANNGVDYTVTLSPPTYASAQITPTAALAAACAGTLSVRRELLLQQPTAIPSVNTLQTAKIEQLLDRLTMMAQQLKLNLGYALQYPDVDDPAFFGRMPLKADRISKYFAWDAAGRPIAAASTAPVGPAMTAFGVSITQAMDVAAFNVIVGALLTSGGTMTGPLGVFRRPITPFNDSDAIDKKFFFDNVRGAKSITTNGFFDVLVDPTGSATNGLLYMRVQWGSVTVLAGAGLGINFPSPFTTNPFAIIPIGVDSGANASMFYDSVTFAGYVLHNTAAVSHTYNWVAIGRYEP